MKLLVLFFAVFWPFVIRAEPLSKKQWAEELDKVIGWGLPETKGAKWVRPGLDPAKEEVRWWAQSGDLPACGAWLFDTRANGERLILMGESIYQVMSGSKVQVFNGGGEAWTEADPGADAQGIIRWVKANPACLADRDLRLRGHWLLLAARLHGLQQTETALALAQSIAPDDVQARALEEAALGQLVEGLSETASQQLTWNGDFKNWAAVLTRAANLDKQLVNKEGIRADGRTLAPFARWLAAQVPEDAGAFARTLDLPPEQQQLVRRLLTEPCFIHDKLPGGVAWLLAPPQPPEGSAIRAIFDLHTKGIPLLRALRGHKIPIPLLWDAPMGPDWAYAKWLREGKEWAADGVPHELTFRGWIPSMIPMTLDGLGELLTHGVEESWLEHATGLSRREIASEWIRDTNTPGDLQKAAKAWLSGPEGGAEGRKQAVARIQNETQPDAKLHALLEYLKTAGPAAASDWAELKPAAMKAMDELTQSKGGHEYRLLASREMLLAQCESAVSRDGLRCRLMDAAKRRIPWTEGAFTDDIKRLSISRSSEEVISAALEAAATAPDGDTATMLLTWGVFGLEREKTTPLTPRLRELWTPLLKDTRPILAETPLFGLTAGDAAWIQFACLHGAYAGAGHFAPRPVIHPSDFRGYHIAPNTLAAVRLAREYGARILGAEHGPPPSPWALSAEAKDSLLRRLRDMPADKLEDAIRNLSAEEEFYLSVHLDDVEWQEIAGRLRSRVFHVQEVQYHPDLNEPPLEELKGRPLTVGALHDIMFRMRLRSQKSGAVYCAHALSTLRGIRIRVVKLIAAGAPPAPLEVPILDEPRIKTALLQAREQQADQMSGGSSRWGWAGDVPADFMKWEGREAWDDFQRCAGNLLENSRTKSPLSSLVFVTLQHFPRKR